MEESRSSSRGSYELYDSQKGPLSGGDIRGRSSPAMAPGCPGSPQDTQQMLEEYRKEISDRKMRENNLLQIIQELRGSQNMGNSGNFGEGQLINAEGASGSHTTENVGENVKDAHIKDLERQVIFLKANLYKNNRAAEEKDKAVNELRMVSAQLNVANEENSKLRQDVNRLNATCIDLQQKLRQNLEDLEVESRHERCQSQMTKLQEELMTTKAQLETLRESVTRLSQENKSLKEGGVGVQGSGSLSNMECSQELEYLHKVVDTLKNTVLEQRNILVNMKMPLPQINGGPVPNGSNSAMSDQLLTMPRSSNGFNSNNGRLSDSSNHADSTPGIGIPVPLVDERGEAAAMLARAPVLASPKGFEDPELQTPPALAPKKNFNYMPMSQERRSSDPRRSPPVVQSSAPDQQPNGRLVQAAGGLPQASGGVPQSRKPPLQAQSSAPQRKISHSEVVARRAFSDATKPPEKLRSKTDTILRQVDKPMDTKPFPQWMLTRGQADMPNIVADLPKFQAAMPPQIPVPAGVPGINYEAAEMSPAMAAQFNLIGSGSRPPTGSPQRLQQNPPSSPSRLHQQQQQQSQQKFPPPIAHENGAVRVINHDMMGGGRMVQKNDTPATIDISQGSRTSGPAWQNGHVNNGNLPLRGAVGAPILDSDVDPPKAQLNADRVCPVCNKNYGSLSMEDFQAHVFECFDDENAPETMKPEVASSDRTCPMCNTRFGGSTSQAEYEKHVHSHFGEEGPGENFEILQP